MKSVSGKTLCKIVERKGWILKRVAGGIQFIPVHENRDLLIETIKKLILIKSN